MKWADLHIHTYYSDSTSSPEEVIEAAHTIELDCIAISDHDTMDGVRPTQEAAKKYNKEVIPAVELSTETNGRDIHILGYFFNGSNQAFNERLNQMQDIRLERMVEMIEKLKGLGVKDITLEEVAILAKSKSVGRPHLATILMQKGHVSSIKMAFDQFLAEGKSAYVPKFKLSCADGIKLIHESGGIAVLAHPMVTGKDEIIAGLVRAGLDGMEVYYPNTGENVINFYKGLAEKHGLLLTGGSDAHGQAKKNTWVGKVKIPYELVEKLKSYKRK